MINKMKNSGKRISVGPMTAYEYRIILFTSQRNNDVRNFSKGKDLNRRITFYFKKIDEKYNE